MLFETIAEVLSALDGLNEQEVNKLKIEYIMQLEKDNEEKNTKKWARVIDTINFVCDIYIKRNKK